MNVNSATLTGPAIAGHPASVWQRLCSLVAQMRRGTPTSAEAAAARDAEAVRALADRYRRSDPGFASDLYAAAARYESSLDGKA
jgi:hypothetical protein